jgi:hypothetical protein
VVALGVDQGADGAAGGAVIPAVGAEEDDVHASSPSTMCGISIAANISLEISLPRIRRRYQPISLGISLSAVPFRGIHV